MNNNSLTIAAIAVLAALLATGAVISSEIAFAGGHHYSESVRQTVTQIITVGAHDAFRC